MLDLFAMIFLIGGLISAFSPISQLYQLNKARYRTETYAEVISVQIKEEIKDPNLFRISSKTKVWITKEEMIVEGRHISYEGKYYEEPQTRIPHTLISKDGIHWSVNDTNTHDLIAGIAAGLICSLAGIAILFLHYKNSF